MGNYYILSGRKNSGKTTKLQKFVKSGKYNCGGILTLTNGKERVFDSICDKNTKQMTVKYNSSEPYYSIGHYCFSISAFDFANNAILSSNRKENQFVIVDEAGFLELENTGFHKALKILTNPEKLKAENLIIVVRDFLVEKIIKHYSLDEQNVTILNNLTALLIN